MSHKNEKFWTLPNTITIGRIVISLPALTVLALNPGTQEQHLCSIVVGWIMVAAGISDHIDGRLARKYGETVTGAFLDATADKVMTSAAWVAFAYAGRLSPEFLVMAVIMVAREHIVDGLRTVAATKQVNIKASPLGKAKTVCQIVAICGLSWYYQDGSVIPVREIGLTAMEVGTVISVVSGAQYGFRVARLVFGTQRA